MEVFCPCTAWVAKRAMAPLASVLLCCDIVTVTLVAHAHNV